MAKELFVLIHDESGQNPNNKNYEKFLVNFSNLFFENKKISEMEKLSKDEMIN